MSVGHFQQPWIHLSHLTKVQISTLSCCSTLPFIIVTNLNSDEKTHNCNIIFKYTLYFSLRNDTSKFEKKLIRSSIEDTNSNRKQVFFFLSIVLNINLQKINITLHIYWKLIHMWWTNHFPNVLLCKAMKSKEK